MSNKPCIIFNPDFNKIVLDPSTNRLITKGELARKTINPAPIAPPKPVIKVADKPAVPAPPKPVIKVADKPAVPAPPKPAIKAADKPAVPAPPKPAIKAAGKPALKSADKPKAKEVKFDISASLNPHIPKPLNNKGPLVIPSRGGYGAVILGRGRR
jgi:hypothetical protein